MLYKLPKGLQTFNFDTTDGSNFYNGVLGRGTNPPSSMPYNVTDLEDFLSLSTKNVGDTPWTVNTNTDEGFFNGHVIT
jgi:hypothetical protein